MIKNNEPKNYTEIYQTIKKIFEQSPYLSSGHLDETYYTLRVFIESENLIKILSQNNCRCEEQLVLISSLFHDVGKSDLAMFKSEADSFSTKNEEWSTHPKKGVPIVKKVLSSLNFTNDFIEKVSFLVANHDKRLDFKGEKSIELKILQDADLLADVGMPGFIRPLLYAGQKKRSTIETITYLQNDKGQIDELNKLNLEISKGIAIQKLQRQKELSLELKDTIKTNLIKLE